METKIHLPVNESMVDGRDAFTEPQPLPTKDSGASPIPSASVIPDHLSLINNDLTEDFIHSMRYRYSEETVSKYKKGFGEFKIFCSKPLLEVTRQDISQWIVKLIGEGNSSSTINHKLAILRNLYRFYLDKGFIRINPTSGIRNLPRRATPPRYLEGSEVIMLMDAVKNNLRDRAIIELLITTGIRRRELVNLKKDSVNLENKILFVGTSIQQRTVLLADSCLLYIKQYLDSRDDNCSFLFASKTGKPLPSWSIPFLINKYSREAGLDKYVNLITLRNTSKLLRCFGCLDGVTSCPAYSFSCPGCAGIVSTGINSIPGWCNHD